MLLEDAIKDTKRATELLELMKDPIVGPGRKDDYMVRPYLVRAHWRRRPKKRLQLIRKRG